MLYLQNRNEGEQTKIRIEAVVTFEIVKKERLHSIYLTSTFLRR